VRITSIARETGRAHNLAAFRRSIAQQFALAFEREAQIVAPERLSAAVAAALAG
jgi:hypothetical protein